MLLHITETNRLQTLDQAVLKLKNGGLIVYPTDTIYGIGCDALNQSAVNKIYQLKGRDDRKPMSFICHDIEQIKKFAQLSSDHIDLLERNLPGAFTFILEASQGCPDHLKSQNNTVGIRIPDNQICLELVRKLDSPIITTSINQSGQPPLNDPQEIEAIFGDRLDLILDAGEIKGSASTIVDLTQPESKIIRKGESKLI